MFEKPSTNKDETEKPIPNRPRLRNIEDTLVLLESEEGPDGEKINWKDLYEKVGPWESGLELSNEIRDIIRDYLLSKFPTIKERIPSIKDLPDDKLVNALSNGWFEEIKEALGKNSRKEVLLSVLAHITKRIETRIYKKVFEQADDKEFEKLGLDPNLHQLVIDILDASVKSDPLFIRFLAYSQLAPKPPEDANPIAPIGQDGKPHRFAELFPHETQFISKKLKEIIKSKKQWENVSGAKEFEEYLNILEKYFSGTEIEKASELEEEIKSAYARVIASEFPIIISPPLGGYYKPPYFDPELRVSIRTPESIAEEDKFLPLQKALANNIELLGVGQFADSIRSKPIRSVISIGAYGSNLTFTAAAEADKEIVLFLDDQIRHFDKNLKKFFPLVEISDQAFRNVPVQRIEEMSREDTMFHELSHPVYFEDTHEAKRLGPEPESVIAEVSAESIHRGLAKELIEKGEIKYTPEQYITVTICMPIQVIERSDPDDEYYQAAVYVLNGMLEQGLIEFDGSKIRVTNTDAIFDYLKDNAKKIIALYEDAEMNEGKAKKWVEANCVAGEKLQELIEFVKTRNF